MRVGFHRTNGLVQVESVIRSGVTRKLAVKLHRRIPVRRGPRR